MRRLFPALLALLLLILLIGSVPSGVSGAPARDDGAALSRAIEIVVRSHTTPPPHDELAREALAAIDAEPALASWDWLREPLLARPPDMQKAEERLRTASISQAAERPGRIDAATARDTLSQVLADPRFHPGDWRDLVPGWLLPAVIVVGKLVASIWNLIRWPVDRLLDLLGYLIGSPLIAVLGLLVVVGIVALYRAGLRSVLVRQAEISVAPDALPPTAAEALAAAQRQAAVGRYREASHFVLLSTLLWIEEHGDARFDPSATNREHLRRAQAAGPAVSRALSPLVASFDQVWYGGESVTETDYRSLLALAGHVREATG